MRTLPEDQREDDALANSLTQLLTDHDRYTHEVARWLRDQQAADTSVGQLTDGAPAAA